MSFIQQNITSAGVTIDALIGAGQYANILTTSSGSVTLAANVVISATTTSGEAASVIVRWQADLTLSTFSVSLFGFTINQSAVNQDGTFNAYFDGTSWTVQYTPDAIELPQQFYGVQAVTAPTSGTITLVSGVSKSYQRISGGPTALVGNLVVTASTVGVIDGSTFDVEIAGGITIGSNTMTVFGVTIGAYYALNGGGKVTAIFDGTANVWRGIGVSNSIQVDSIAPIGDGRVICNPGTSPASPSTVFLSSNGDILTKRSGILVADKIDVENFKSLIYPISQVTVSVSNSEASNLFTTPKSLITTAVTARKIVAPTFIVLEVIYGAAAFASNTTLLIKYDSAAQPMFRQEGGITATANAFFMFEPQGGSVTGSQIIPNDDFVLTIAGGAPTGGTGTALKIHMFYFEPVLQ